MSCGAMLHLFKGLFIHARGLDLVGRNTDNVLAVRGVDCRELWEQINELAQDMSERWSRETKLGESARYITRNYDKLTAYLEDPRLSLTNNFAERMLRMEKLIENSSLFRTSLEGRFALDIMRTVLQTAVAARAPLQPYLLAVLRASPDEVAANPECFTPQARAAAHSGSQPEPVQMDAVPINNLAHLHSPWAGWRVVTAGSHERRASLAEHSPALGVERLDWRAGLDRRASVRCT